jgi:hypothetical protein
MCRCFAACGVKFRAAARLTDVNMGIRPLMRCVAERQRAAAAPSTIAVRLLSGSKLGGQVAVDLEADEAAPARLTQGSGSKLRFEHGGIFMTLQVAFPMSYLHERYLGQPPCPNYGKIVMAPEHPECLSDDEIRHFWACNRCDNRYCSQVQCSRCLTESAARRGAA